MDNRIKRIIIALVVCLILPCLAACGSESTLDACVFRNITYVEYTDLENIEHGVYWIETLEEYEALGLDKEYDKKFFKDNVLLLVKTQWNDSGPDRTLLDEPVIENDVLYPVISTYSYPGMMSSTAIETTVMIAEADKKYAEMTLGDVKRIDTDNPGTNGEGE